MKIPRSLLSAAFALSLGGSVAASDTYVWPDATYPDFYDLVVNIMAPGDSLVMLEDATYLHSQPLFVQDIELYAPEEVIITAIAVDEVVERPVAFFFRARARNIRFEWNDAGFEIVRNFGAEGGQSYFDSCTFVGSSARGSGDDGGSAFRHCPMPASTFIDCTFVGGEGGDAIAGSGELQAGVGGHGLEIMDPSRPCTLVSCLAQGGRGGDGVDPFCVGDDLVAGDGGDGIQGDLRENPDQPTVTRRGRGGFDLDCVDGTDDGADGVGLAGNLVPMTGYTFAVSAGPGGMLEVGTRGYTGPTALFAALGTTGSPGDLHGERDVSSLDSTRLLLMIRRGDVSASGPYDPAFAGLRVYYQVLSLDPTTRKVHFDPSASLHLLDH